MNSDPLTIFTTIITCLTPIFVAWGGWKVSLSQKESKRYHELLDKYNKERDDNEKAKEAAREEREQAMDEKITKLEKMVADLANSTESSDLEERVEKLYSLTTINHDYIQSVSNVMISIGEGLVLSGALKPETESSVHEAIDKHRATEKELQQKIYKIVY